MSCLVETPECQGLRSPIASTATQTYLRTDVAVCAEFVDKKAVEKRTTVVIESGIKKVRL
jgi:hypothetical protein